MLVIRIFSFSHNVFLKAFLVRSINPFPNKPWFLHVCSTSLLKTLCEKEKLLVTSNSSFSHINLNPFGNLSDIFIKLQIVVCTLSVWKSLKIFVWKRVRTVLYYMGLTLSLLKTTQAFVASVQSDL